MVVSNTQSYFLGAKIVDILFKKSLKVAKG